MMASTVYETEISVASFGNGTEMDRKAATFTADLKIFHPLGLNI